MTDRSSAIDLDSRSVLKEVLNRLTGSFFEWIKTADIDTENFSQFGAEVWNMRKACSFTIHILKGSKRDFPTVLWPCLLIAPIQWRGVQKVRFSFKSL